MKALDEYINKAEAVEDFEKAIAEFTGAKGVVCVDRIEHAIQLGLLFDRPKMYATIPEQTDLSVAMILNQLGIEYMFTEDEWEKEHRIQGSVVYRSDDFSEGMFETENPNQRKILCVSLEALGIHGAAILTNVKEVHNWMKLAANGGIDPVSPDKATELNLGYYYQLRPADAVAGMAKLENKEVVQYTGKGYKDYSSLRDITINK